MKKISTMLLTFTLMSCALFSSALCQAQEKISGTMKYGGFDREYKLYLPSAREDKTPLILLLHGYGGNTEGWDKMSAAAEREGFALLLAQGTPDPNGTPCWNVHYDSQKGMTVNDTRFLAALVKKVTKEYGLSPKNRFCMGFSNGADMTYLMSSAYPKLFAASACVAGVVMKWMHDRYDGASCVPLMEIHGNADNISYWTGDADGSSGYGIWYPVPEGIALWAEATGAKFIGKKELPHIGGSKVFLHSYVSEQKSRNSGAPIEVRLYEIDGGGHSFSTEDINVETEIISFFKKYMAEPAK